MNTVLPASCGSKRASIPFTIGFSPVFARRSSTKISVLSPFDPVAATHISQRPSSETSQPAN
jgi:hypothetical protein